MDGGACERAGRRRGASSAAHVGQRRRCRPPSARALNSGCGLTDESTGRASNSCRYESTMRSRSATADGQKNRKKGRKRDRGWAGEWTTELAATRGAPASRPAPRRPRPRTVVVAVEPEARVGGVVVVGVKLLELLKGEVGDGDGVATAVLHVRVAGEQRVLRGVRGGAGVQGERRAVGGTEAKAVGCSGRQSPSPAPPPGRPAPLSAARALGARPPA